MQTECWFQFFTVSMNLFCSKAEQIYSGIIFLTPYSVQQKLVLTLQQTIIISVCSPIALPHESESIWCERDKSSYPVNTAYYNIRSFSQFYLWTDDYGMLIYMAHRGVLLSVSFNHQITWPYQTGAISAHLTLIPFRFLYVFFVDN